MTKNKESLPIEFLKRCELVTRTFEKKKGIWNMHWQLLHMYDEVNEVQKAFGRGDMDNFKEECCDVILTGLTALHLLDVKPEEIQQAMEEKLTIVEKRCGIKEF